MPLRWLLLFENTEQGDTIKNKLFFSEEDNMQTFFKFIKIIFEISLIMILYYITGTFLPVIYKVSILCWIAVTIIVLLFNYNFLIKLFIKEEKKKKMIYLIFTTLTIQKYSKYVC